MMSYPGSATVKHHSPSPAQRGIKPHIVNLQVAGQHSDQLPLSLVNVGTVLPLNTVEPRHDKTNRIELQDNDQFP